MAERVNNEKWPHHNSPFKSTIAIRKPKSFQSLCHWNSNCRIYPPLVRSRATLRALYTWPRNAHLEHHEPLNVRLHKLAPAMGHLPRLRNCPSIFINMIHVKFWAALFFFVRRIGSSVSSSTSERHTTPQQIHFPPVRWLFKDIEIDWSISKCPNLGKVAAASDSVSIRKMSGNEIFFSSQDENPFCGRFLGAYWQLKAILATSANAQLLQISANGRSSRTVDLWMIFNELDRQMNS